MYIAHEQVTEVNSPGSPTRIVSVRSDHFSRKIPVCEKKSCLRGKAHRGGLISKGPVVISGICQTADDQSIMLWIYRERAEDYAEPPHYAVLVVGGEPKGQGGHRIALSGSRFPDMHTRARGGSRQSLCWLRNALPITNTAGVHIFNERLLLRLLRSVPLATQLA